MHTQHRSRLLASCLLALFATSCAGDYTIQLQNDTAGALVPYPVVTSPPPPHREADLASVVAVGSSRSIDPESFNPLFFSELRKISLTLQLSLDLDPPQILGRTMLHVVPPGQEGTDPALQPTQLEEMLFEPTSKNLTFVVAGGEGFPISMVEN